MTQRRTYYPPIEPFRTGMLPVDHGHVIYFEESGNPKGKPVIFVHTEPETFKIRYVQPGAANGEQTVVLGGEVNENDRVVTVGTYQLKSIYLNQ